MADFDSLEDLSPKQQRQLLEILIEKIVKDSMADGIRAASTMVRLAPANLPRNELADLIEKTADA